MKKISIIIPVYNVDPKRFEKTLNSLVNQTVNDFEVCISDGGEHKIPKKLLEKFDSKLEIKYSESKKKLGIADNTNAAIKLATGDYIAFLDHDDRILENAIEEAVKVIDDKYPDVIYSDEEVVDEYGMVLNKFYKPDFSYDLLYSQNYICHFLLIKKSVHDFVGKVDSKYDGAQDYDYILRVCEATQDIYHIPKILYDWISWPESTATNSDAKPYAQTAGLNALDAHLKRVYGKKAKAVETENLFVYKPEFDILENKKVDIIIPMRDKWPLTKQCVDSILELTKYKNYQITIIDNGSVEDATFEWFKKVKEKKNVRVLRADFEFNWSKLQNFGIKNSDADVFIFLNNDTIMVDENWLTELCSNALRDEVGVVGPLMLYEDGTIQHGGVVVGLNGYADHLYKNMKPIHAGINFPSPMVARNVLAVTGACMAISRKTLDKIGYFNENFIICGSDVEICLRAYEMGLRNIYTPNTRIIHLESKSRDTYIPEIDFKLSKVYYSKYWKNGDPFFNKNLDINSPIPKEKGKETAVYVNNIGVKTRMKKLLKKSKVITYIYRKLKKTLKKNPFAVKVYRKIKHLPSPANEQIKNNRIIVDYTIPEIKEITPIKGEINKKYRINILIPSLNKDKVFGGISTAMKFFNQFNDEDYAKRIIVTDTAMKDDDLDNYKDYELIDNLEESKIDLQVVNIHDQANCNLVVTKNDIFLATAWWTAYSIRNIIKWQKETYKLKKCHNLLYFIQDYEPYFYPWSSRQSSAESTYHLDIPTVAIFNSKELMDYFNNHNYKFVKSYYFSPILNDSLKKHLLEDEELPRKKQIVVYGRPSVARNAFEIVEESLILAFKDRDDIDEWKFISMGEEHYDAKIKDDVTLKSVGKLSLDEYALMMEESYLGISLMVSPHPSYPPLEMSSFGIKTITNKYENKDISYFNDNIISVDYCDAEYISKEIIKLVDNYDKLSKKSKKIINKDYINSSDQFGPIIKDIIAINKKEQ